MDERLWMHIWMDEWLHAHAWMDELRHGLLDRDRSGLGVGGIVLIEMP